MRFLLLPPTPAPTSCNEAPGKMPRALHSTQRLFQVFRWLAPLQRLCGKALREINSCQNYFGMKGELEKY